MIRLAVLLVLLLLPLAPVHAADCAAPPDLVEATLPLTATAAALRAGSLRIVALGSASILGPGTSSPEAAWPQRLLALLRARYPSAKIEIAVHGGRGMTAAALLARLETALQPPPQLVIWQTGGVEAIRNLPADDLTDALDEGIMRSHDAGADVVLMDQQFSRFLRANTDIDTYRNALRVSAAADGAVLFRRYDLMRLWAETGEVDLEHTSRERLAEAADRLNRCLAEALVTLLEQGIALAGR